MWCPSVSLSVWANAWLAGTAAPDDVLDALSLWAPQHFIAAYDSVAAGNTGLPWPDVDEASVITLLRTLRTAAGKHTGEPSVNVVLPVPGDVRGLPAGTGFERDALAAGEALIVTGDRNKAVGIVPEFDYGDGDSDADDGGPRALVWTVYALPAAPPPVHVDLGEAEYALRSAVRSAAEALEAVRPGAGVSDPRGMIEQVLECSRRHRIPADAPARALRVLENAAQVDAIIAVSSDLMPIGPQTLSDTQIANDALKPLAAVVRSARMAAITAILHSPWH
ncbi:MAG TPA: hypothetical protein VFB19_09160 [Mycobacterium sp.]|nr:hypothetical protein [Mycobacterium sp.]